MKKIVACLICLIALFGCSQIDHKINEMTTPHYKKIRQMDELLETVLKHLADNHSELSLLEGKLVDAELGIPRYENFSHTTLEHFNSDEIKDGIVVKPVVDDDPHLIIILEANGKEEAGRALDTIHKIHSDQIKKFHDEGIMVDFLVNSSEYVRQGNYVMYITWEKAQDAIRVFERHVR